MANPAHPGTSILYGCLGVVGEDEDVLEVAEAASKLGVPRETLQRVLDGHAPVTPDLARRLEAVGWSTAEFWLGCTSDLWRNPLRLPPHGAPNSPRNAR